MRGDAYFCPQDAHRLLEPFGDQVDEEFAAEYGVENYPSLAIPRAIAATQELARDTDGITSVPAWQPVITGQEISRILATILGVETGGSKAIGRGYQAREVHEETMANITDTLGFDPMAEEEA